MCVCVTSHTFTFLVNCHHGKTHRSRGDTAWRAQTDTTLENTDRHEGTPVMRQDES